jgi:electron transfer flavoprotein beta subunit
MTTQDTRGPVTVVACVRYVLDADWIGTDPATRPSLASAACKISDFDENAIETALRLRDEQGGRAVAVSVLPARPPDHMLLRVLAMGMDELHLVCDAGLQDCDALATAEVLAALIRTLGSFDLVVCGDTSVDEHRGEVGPRLGEVLGIPALTHVTDLRLSGDGIRADRALESWLETVAATLPVLITVGSETNQPRIPSVLNILRARKKPVVEWPLADLVPTEVYLGAARIETLEMHGSATVRKRIVLDGASPVESARALVHHLLEDAVISF